jgi:hypothetical protein
MVSTDTRTVIPVPPATSAISPDSTHGHAQCWPLIAVRKTVSSTPIGPATRNHAHCRPRTSCCSTSGVVSVSHSAEPSSP